MPAPRRKGRARYADIEALPENVVGEIVDGELNASPRPAGAHSLASSALGMSLSPYHRSDGSGGRPGGWWILDEPELHLGADIMVPDLAGWRMARLPDVDGPFFTLAPDWVCEVLSPGTARLDLILKLPKYARAGVEHAWVVDPLNRFLQVFRKPTEGAGWILLETFAGEDTVRAEPFPEAVIDLAMLWPPKAGEGEAKYQPRARPARQSGRRKRAR